MTSDREAVKQAVLAIVSEVLDVPVQGVVDDPVLATHAGWDSLRSLELLAQVEKKFRVSLDLRRYHAGRTVDDLVDLISGAEVASGQG